MDNSEFISKIRSLKIGQEIVLKASRLCEDSDQLKAFSCDGCVFLQGYHGCTHDDCVLYPRLVGHRNYYTTDPNEDYCVSDYLLDNK
jgi:hypothetical protein